MGSPTLSDSQSKNLRRQQPARIIPPLLTHIRRRHNEINIAALNEAHFLNLKLQRIKILSQKILNAFNKSDGLLVRMAYMIDGIYS